MPNDNERVTPAEVLRTLAADTAAEGFNPKNELLDNDDSPSKEELAALKAQGLVLLPDGRLAHESELDPETDTVIPPPQSANLERRYALRKLAESQGLSVGEGLEDAAYRDHVAALEREIETQQGRTKEWKGREDVAATAQRRLEGAKAELAYLKEQGAPSESGTTRGSNVDSDGTTKATREDAAKARQAAGQTRQDTPQGRKATPAAGKTTAAE